jgi:hypothetical protein
MGGPSGGFQGPRGPGVGPPGGWQGPRGPGGVGRGAHHGYSRSVGVLGVPRVVQEVGSDV